MSRWGTDHEPVGFWTILFAVFGGILLADFVRVLVAALLLKAFIGANPPPLIESIDFGRVLDQIEQPARLYVPPVESLEGPSTARAAGLSMACIGGYVADRLNAGWDQRTPLVRCRQQGP